MIFKTNFFLYCVFIAALPLSVPPIADAYSIVTGASGYVGRAICHELIRHQDEDVDIVYCLVRPSKVAAERTYWRMISNNTRVLPYDMVDGGTSFRNALEAMQQETPVSSTSQKKCIHIYHVASYFGPTSNHRQTALDNVRGAVDLVEALGAFKSKASKRDDDNGDVPEYALLLTSSMAAVRGAGQNPINGEYYTHEDWNTASQLGTDSWGASYQWSKAEAERSVVKLCQHHSIPLTCLCPSFVFGPPHAVDQTSFSLELVKGWVEGTSPVQSRLIVDVRDVARAHVQAAARGLFGKRYIVSCERRVSSREIASWIKDVCPEDTREKIHYDAQFTGGAIQIGDLEVEARRRLREDLGLELRPVKDTIVETVQKLL